MKKFCLYSLLVVLTLALLGCACGTTSQSTGPENPTFNVLAEDAECASVLAYFQAHTGYLPTVAVLDDETIAAMTETLTEAGQPAERADVLKAMADGATCLLLKSESLIAEYEALGLTVDNDALKSLSAQYRIDNAGTLGITIVQMPSGSEINSAALSALAAWLTGPEALYLEKNPDLLH